MGLRSQWTSPPQTYSMPLQTFFFLDLSPYMTPILLFRRRVLERTITKIPQSPQPSPSGWCICVRDWIWVFFIWLGLHWAMYNVSLHFFRTICQRTGKVYGTFLPNTHPKKTRQRYDDIPIWWYGMYIQPADLPDELIRGPSSPASLAQVCNRFVHAQ